MNLKRQTPVTTTPTSLNLRFDKPFTQQEPMPDAAIGRVVELMQSGRLHRYNTLVDEVSEVSLLEQDYAAWQGQDYCLAVTSGGQAIQLALRAVGVSPGETVLANAYTLAPVPGAIHAVGAKPLFVEIKDNWHIDIDDLESKARKSGAKYLLLSHMRGHLADMAAVAKICDENGLILIEDCAHTMGARWGGVRSGNFGKVACFSTQTYKHMNSGEGGFLTTNDPDVAARAVVSSGSYMLYGRHGAIPPESVFRASRLFSPNCSARLDNLRAALLRAQMPNLEKNCQRWNRLYQAVEIGLQKIPGLVVPKRAQEEAYVGSSFQFRLTSLPTGQIPDFVQACGERGVEIKWFGPEEPQAFTSRFDSWKYLGPAQDLPKTLATLKQTCDLRLPLTFSEGDAKLIAKIIVQVLESLQSDKV